MKSTRTLSTVIFLLVFLCGSLIAQEMPEIKLRNGGTVQFWGSMGQINGADTNSMGFGLRRVRFRNYIDVGDNMKAFVQTELTTFKLLDARVEYLFSKNFQVRVGRFIGAGVRAGGLTIHSVIDITERAFTAQRWGASTVGADFRDYGVDFVGSYGAVKVNATVHNGDGSKNMVNRMSGPSTKNGSFAFSGMVTVKPSEVKGLEFGGYYGVGNKQINDYSAFNAFVYYEPMPLKLKAEVIGWTNKTAAADISQLGYYVFGAYKVIDNVEVLARFENFDANTDVDKNDRTFITLGASYAMFPSKWLTSKITAAYVIANEDADIDNNSFQLVCQFVF